MSNARNIFVAGRAMGKSVFWEYFRDFEEKKNHKVIDWQKEMEIN